MDTDVQFVCAYLKAHDSNALAEKEITCKTTHTDANYQVQSASDCRQLLVKHFLGGDASRSTSYFLLQSFIRYLACQLRGFSSTCHLSIDILRYTHEGNGPGIPLSVRQEIVHDLIVLAQRFITRSGAAESQRDNVKRTREAAAAFSAHTGLRNRRAEDVAALMTARDIDENIEQALVCFFNGTVVPFYRHLETVPASLINYYKLLDREYKETMRARGRPPPPDQQLRELSSIGHDELVKRLQDAVCDRSKVNPAHVELPRLALTADNVTKMIMILLRLDADLPVLLMGESGCGKVRVNCSMHHKYPRHTHSPDPTDNPHQVSVEAGHW